jgi:hypothetical protein
MLRLCVLEDIRWPLSRHGRITVVVVKDYEVSRWLWTQILSMREV